MLKAPLQFGEILVQMGCVTTEQVDAALLKQMQGDSRKIGEIFLADGLCSVSDISTALAEQFDMDIVDLDGVVIQSQVIGMLSREHCWDNRVIPLDFFEDTVTLAISDPLDLVALDNIRYVLNHHVEPMLATRDAIEKAILKYYGDGQSPEDAWKDTEIEFINVDKKRDEAERAHYSDEAPVIRLIQHLVEQAVRCNASDIHIEPMQGRLRIRYRIDGVCYEVDSPDKRLQGSIITCLKAMTASMKIEEKRQPQDGKISHRRQGMENLDLRVSTLPAIHGESVVLRILDKRKNLVSLSDLGFSDHDSRTFHGLLKKPNGIILICGPTGSGKTTTLYSALQELNKPDCKIITAENPVEYTVRGLNQCQINPEVGLTFKRALRAMLRQAPNVILIGEIRDRETSEIAIQAALTGHLVFSTVHTNDAPSAITRLIDLGVQPFLVANSIQAVQAQRLVRMICPHCRMVDPEPNKRLLELYQLNARLQGCVFYKGAGCEHCMQTGFKGRKGIFEILVMNNKLRDLAFNKATADAIRSQARIDGMSTLFEDGLKKVIDGLTTLDEVCGEAVVHT